MRWTVPGAIAGAILLLPAAALPAPRYSNMTQAGRDAFALKARKVASLPRRLAAVSAPFVGTPYAFSPLGEGKGVDADPLIRWDAVDCVTLVETSIALALAPTSDKVLPLLNDIRYGAGPPDFNRRNHFVEAEWVPNNVAKGYLRATSREVAGDQTIVVTTEITRRRWRHARASSLPLAAGALPIGRFPIEVVPLAFAVSHPARLPDGTLLFVVRKDLQHGPTRVSHAGFVLVKGKRRVLRHASREPYGRVVDEPLASFFARNARYDKRPVLGFALFEVLDPAARISGLEAPAGGGAPARAAN